MTTRERIGVGFMIVAMSFFFAAMVALAFVATGLIYDAAGFTPSPLAAQIANALLGGLLAFLALALIGRIFASRRGELAVLGPILDAIDRIAAGDFAVRLDEARRDNHAFSTLAQRVNTMASGLEQIEGMRREFIANVSHEIQSPLTSIRGFARALQSEQLAPDERGHYLSIIETECMRLSKLSDNLLTLAALEAGGLQPAAEPYRLDQQIREVVLAAEPQWVARDLDVEVDLAPATVVADADRLRQVWTNLLHNSVKFTPPGGQIRIALRQEGAGGVAVSVADTGVGIAEGDVPHLFERFFKADRARGAAQSGSGLGLSIAHTIVELHGGTIDVASAPGAGSTFTVRLPATTHGA